MPSFPLPLLIALSLLPAASGRAPVPARSATTDGGPVVAGEQGRALDAHLSRLATLGFSGAALVVRDGEVVLSKGYGLADREAGVANGPDVLYPLGSITKHFTAACVLRLAMDGVLSLDDTLERWFEDVPPDKRAITLHQLLCHTAGFPEAGGGAAEAVDRDSFVRTLFATELVFPPGSASSYSNLGYGLLAAVAEEASGVPYARLLREIVLEPAGMGATTYAPGREVVQAHGTIDGRDTGTLLEAFGGAPPFGLLGNGGLQSTLEDMRAWHVALREHTVLDEASLEAMATPHVRYGPEFAMGYGCGVVDTPLGRRIGHSGSNDVFSAHFLHWLDVDLFVFLTANDADMYVSGPLRGVERILYGEEPPATPEAIELPAERLAVYAGEWRLGEDELVEVGVDAAGLTVSSGTPRASALVNPVQPGQRARRDALLHDVAEAFERAFAGDYEPLHELLDPYAPLEAFVADQGAMLDGLVRRDGPLVAVRTAAGRNRFGEIAIVVALELEGGTTLLEYSFGEREVGSIRFLADWPERLVRPESPAVFLHHDPEAGTTWRVRFELDDEGRPRALVLADEAGEEHVLRRP